VATKAVRHAGSKATAGDRLIASLKEAVAWSQGKHVPARVTTIEVPKVDVRQIREKLQLSQNEFAARFGFAPASIRNWEQGRRRPEGPARVLLAVIDRHPELVEDVLRGPQSGSPPPV
jgi:putative transcriptional regulator